MTVFLTRPIGNNDDGFIDWKVVEIQSVPDGEQLNSDVCCPGGSTAQGLRLRFAVSQHKGHRKARAIGFAASMATTYLAAFDEIEIVRGTTLMFHKAFYADEKGNPVPLNKYTPAQLKSIQTYNQETYDLWVNKPVQGTHQNPDQVLSKRNAFFKEVYLSASTEDYNLTAQEASELGIGKLIEVEERNNEAFEMAASLDVRAIKSHYKDMSFFSRKKEVFRTINLADGGMIGYASVNEGLTEGITASLENSSDELNGSYKLENGMVATFENGVVKSVEEKASATVSLDRFETLEKMVNAMPGKIVAMFKEKDKEEKESKDSDEDEEESKDDDSEMKNQIAEMQKNMSTVLNAMKNISSDFKLPNVQENHEKMQEEDFMKNMTPDQKRAYQMREYAKKIDSGEIKQ